MTEAAARSTLGAKLQYPLLLETDRLVLEQATPGHAAAAVAFFNTNAAHLAPWTDLPPPQMRHVDAFGAMFERIGEGWQKGVEDAQLRMLFRLKEDRDETAGFLAFTRFRWRFDLCCTMAFAVAARHQGEGYVTEAATRGIEYVFDELRMHRVDAEHRTDNLASAAVLARCGFHVIGVAPRFRFAAGAWRDHTLTTRLNPVDIDPMPTLKPP